VLSKGNIHVRIFLKRSKIFLVVPSSVCVAFVIAYYTVFVELVQ